MSTLLAVSMGCPGGVGAEVTLGAVHDVDPSALRVVVFGDLATLRERASLVEVDPARLVGVATIAEARTIATGSIAVVQVGAPLGPDARRAGRSTREGGAAQLAWIEAACDAVARGDADALVTAPVSKEAVHAAGGAGTGFLGHTEWLGVHLRAPETVMAFVAENFTISLATTHLPLSKVSAALQVDDVVRAAYWTARLVDDLGVDAGLDVVVLALNPHAGEGGLLGTEEHDTIAPGVARARVRLLAEGRHRRVVGPLPAESAIRRCARDGAYAACVAMYHDQATIPSKLVAFGDAVNVTLGLPIVRTSVDHGTAYDVAGTGRADRRGMISALKLGARLAAIRAGAGAGAGALVGGNRE